MKIRALVAVLGALGVVPVDMNGCWPGGIEYVDDGFTLAVPPPVEGFPVGQPIALPTSKWTWVDFPDAVCDDGSTTGIGIWPSATTNKIVFHFAGGGACWDYETCVATSATTHGPYKAAQFANAYLAGSVVDPALSTNPFKDWTKVFVPYCTGDLHAGDAVTTYFRGTVSKTMHHRGRANVAAYLARLAATFPEPQQVVVTGSSAGGGGTLFDYPRFRTYWPNASMQMIDDSLPFFVGDTVSANLRQAWFTVWNLGPVATPICGPDCMNDMSLVYKGLATQYPNDRMALLSTTQDAVISNYYVLNGAQFQAGLKTLATSVLEPTGNFKRYTLGGTAHVLIEGPALFNAGFAGVNNGTPLTTWIAKMISGDPTWASIGPL